MKLQSSVRDLFSNRTALAGWMNVLGTTLFFLALINFFSFCLVTAWIGGDALHGKVENGRYYVAYRKKLTEVSPQVWHLSRAHTISVWITHPLGILGGGGLIALSQRWRKRIAP